MSFFWGTARPRRLRQKVYPAQGYPPLTHKPLGLWRKNNTCNKRRTLFCTKPHTLADAKRRVLPGAFGQRLQWGFWIKNGFFKGFTPALHWGTARPRRLRQKVYPAQGYPPLTHKPLGLWRKNNTCNKRRTLFCTKPHTLADAKRRVLPGAFGQRLQWGFGAKPMRIG